MSGDDVRVAYPLFQEEGGGAIPTSPLQLLIGHISHPKFLELNKLWHSRLPLCENAWRGVGVCFGAEFKGRYYAVAYWSHPVSASIDHHGCYELRRMAICNDAPRYTASRFLAIMVKLLRKQMPTLNRLISYQDTDVHKGTIYKASGWKRIDGVHHKIRHDKGRRDGGYRNAPVATGHKIRWELAL